jgi:hypothetical protein
MHEHAECGFTATSPMRPCKKCNGFGPWNAVEVPEDVRTEEVGTASVCPEEADAAPPVASGAGTWECIVCRRVNSGSTPCAACSEPAPRSPEVVDATLAGPFGSLTIEYERLLVGREGNELVTIREYLGAQPDDFRIVGEHVATLGTFLNVSRPHTQLERQKGGVLVTDLSSKNGTFVLIDGEAVRLLEPLRVPPGQRIELQFGNAPGRKNATMTVSVDVGSGDR